MKYENIDRVKTILAGISFTEDKLELAKEFKSNINSPYSITLCINYSGSRKLLSLSDTQIENVVNDIIKECTEKLEDYKRQLEYL